MDSVINPPGVTKLTRETDHKTKRAVFAVRQLPEAQVLQEAIFKAVRLYYDYLDRHGLLCDSKRERGRASELHVLCDMCGAEIMLKDRMIERPSERRIFRMPLFQPAHNRSQGSRRRRSRGPVEARHRLITQHRLVAVKVKR